MTLTIPQPHNADIIWFKEHKGRQAHIRLPIGKEAEAAFGTLGPHIFSRRRIILWRTAAPLPNGQWPILPIPFLVFSDDSVRDDDETLLPIVDEIMKAAAAEYGVNPDDCSVDPSQPVRRRPMYDS